MSKATSAVTAFYSALGKKRRQDVRSLLAKDFSFKGPMMSFGDPDAFVDAMLSMPMEGAPAGSRFIAEGDSVVHVCTWQMSSPHEAEVPMCEVFSLKDGKISRIDLYFDPKLMEPACDPKQGAAA